MTGMTILKGRMITFFPSDSKLKTDVELRLSGAGYWSLVYTQTNVHGRGKLIGNKLEFLQKDPSGKSAGQTLEIWNFLSPDHIFVENFILGPRGEKEPFLKIMLQKNVGV